MKKVLIVDDEPDIVGLVATVLEGEVSVLAAYDGVEALGDLCILPTEGRQIGKRAKPSWGWVGSARREACRLAVTNTTVVVPSTTFIRSSATRVVA